MDSIEVVILSSFVADALEACHILILGVRGEVL